MEICYRYKEIIKSNELEEIRNNPTKNREDTGHKAKIKELVKQTTKKIKGKNKEELDKILYKDFHKTFKILPFKLTNDIRFWSYLAMNDFLFLVQKRFPGNHPMRYLGSQTKGGLSRHVIARLFWMGEQPFKTAQYKMNDIMIDKQDKYTGLTERELSLSPEISESLVKKSKNQSEDEFRATVKKLRRIGGTKLIYAMNEKDVTKIIK